MRNAISMGLVVLLLGSVMAYAVAEDLTLATYYPSPRGIYQELRTTNETLLAMQDGSVGVGVTAPNAKLDVAMTDGSKPGVTIHGAVGQTADFLTLVDDVGNPVASVDERGYWILGNQSGARLRAKNWLEVKGGAAVGSSYVASQTAPADGLIVEGRAGLGTPNPINALDVAGGVVMGAADAATVVAPANGLSVQGEVWAKGGVSVPPSSSGGGWLRVDKDGFNRFQVYSDGKVGVMTGTGSIWPNGAQMLIENGGLAIGGGLSFVSPGYSWSSDTTQWECAANEYVCGFDCTGFCGTADMKIKCCQFNNFP